METKLELACKSCLYQMGRVFLEKKWVHGKHYVFMRQIYLVENNLYFQPCARHVCTDTWLNGDKGISWTKTKETLGVNEITGLSISPEWREKTISSEVRPIFSRISYFPSSRDLSFYVHLKWLSSRVLSGVRCDICSANAETSSQLVGKKDGSYQRIIRAGRAAQNRSQINCSLRNGKLSRA